MRSPERFNITLEIDRYDDGSVDKAIDFPFGTILPGEFNETAYILNIDWPGTHSFRFVVNKNLDFLEEYHYDNYGEWVLEVVYNPFLILIYFFKTVFQ